MVIQIQNTQTGTSHIEKDVIAITETEGHIDLTYADDIVTGKRYPLDRYKVVAIRSERRR